MLIKSYLILPFLSLISFISIECLEPISTGLAVGAAALAGYAYPWVKCKFLECCSEEYLPGNIGVLHHSLNEKVYGQHIAKEIVIEAIKSHWNSPYAQKALTLSFHGWPGSGKNYVSKYIMQALYKKGAKSAYVHHFMGRIHFPQLKKVDEYKHNIYNWIKGNVTNCPNQLFIFDEVDKIPAGVLDGIKPMLDYQENVEKVDYRKCIFIFLSNTGGSLITKQMVNLWSAGKQRDDIKLSDFENLISQGAFNEEGGFQHSDTIKSNLIDHYIPFLPMELEHVRLCIIYEFAIRGVVRPKEQSIQEVIEFVEWGPKPHNKYSTTGCKRLSQKVALVVQKYRK